jgi:hypothetical protein
MGRIEQFLEVVQDGASLASTHQDDALLRGLVLHIVCADGVVDDSEVSVLLRVFPGHDEDEVRAIAQKHTPLDPSLLASRFTDVVDRARLMELADALAAADGRVVGKELGALIELQAALS